MRVHRKTGPRAGPPYWVEVGPEGKTYHHALTLVNVRTVIDRQRLAECRAAGQRWTVAWVEGERDPGWASSPVDVPRQVDYDPMAHDDFRAGGDPWNVADMILLASDGTAWVYGARYEHD